MGKVKQEPVEGNEQADTSVKGEPQNYDDKIEHCSVIAKPMAPKKLSKKIYKLIKKSSSHKNYIRNGLKIVQKQLRLGEKGIVVFAGDISPIEIMCHLPAVCEEKDVPYCYTPSRKDIGSAMGTMRGCIMVLIKEHEEYKDLYDEVKSEIKYLGHPL
ncbi:H/ACA ribonucleoprotein complex subunit 2-like protein [Papilio machaon]|uniref:H/ACA ribonucleoprotein complex subunit 2-like protein n=2 Tax=Papilio TaxID=7145 RepID=A0AAJ6Z4Y2_PAPXU|nr:PREDICTED: H/ACA ribonucleoprotein complex subunit 2-like protein [Papilio xuthus]KPJ16327.1 H/ACA ribonucleoprotein complex subunit 2-like protein [Papilio machaon]